MITAHLYRCAQCSGRIPQGTSKLRRVYGVRTRVCGPCAERLAQPKPEKEKVAA